jgi:hypothetical protein
MYRRLARDYAVAAAAIDAERTHRFGGREH